MRRLWREPLLHFLLAGALLFVIFDVLNRDRGAAPNEIVVDDSVISTLSFQFERTRGRPPSQQELDGLVNAWLEEELLYREGLSLGLDQNDPLVRRRIAQQMSFIFDAVGETRPDDSELRDWLESNREDYRLPATFSFRQLYFNPEQFGDRLSSVVEQALTALRQGQTNVRSSSSMLPERTTAAPSDRIDNTFGQGFAEQLAQLPNGEWSGPVYSSFGAHVVYIESRTAARDPGLDEVREQVERDVLNQRRLEARAAFVDALRQKYQVIYAEDVPVPGQPGEGVPQ